MEGSLNNVKHSGFTLLETLLVLVCMAAIISWSMHHYQLKQRRVQTLQIESDVKSLRQALDVYFHAAGCKQNGEFSNQVGEISCQELQAFGEVVCSRAPVVAQYTAKLIDTKQTTQGPTLKPVYQLEIQAQISPTLNSKQVALLRQQLVAEAGSGNTLIWDSLPSNSAGKSGDNTWVLDGAGAFFRAAQNQNGADGAPMPEFSGSFCAN